MHQVAYVLMTEDAKIRPAQMPQLHQEVHIVHAMHISIHAQSMQQMMDV